MFGTRFRLSRMTDPALPPEEQAALRQQALLEQRQPTRECLDELAVADFVDGALRDERRATVIAHLARCAHCRSVVRATAALVADATVIAEMSRAERGRRSTMWTTAALGVAAAAALMFMTLPARDESTPREPAVTSANAPATLAPRGSVTAVARVVWSSVPNAERYRVRLHRADGSVLWSAETTDSSIALPDSVRLVPREPYFWRVEAQTEWRRWVASEMTPFRIERTR